MLFNKLKWWIVDEQLRSSYDFSFLFYNIGHSFKTHNELKHHESLFVDNNYFTCG